MSKKINFIWLIPALIFIFQGLFWEKTFQFSSVLDFILGVMSAICVSFAFRLLPLNRKMLKK